MKSKIITLIFTLVTLLIQAQTNEHLTFKGVPIDGTLNDYVSKMKQSGFTLIVTEDGTAYLSGDFAGYKGCTIGVSTMSQKDLVHKIDVVFPDKETWSALSKNYFDLKQMLTEKYGDPSTIMEKFDREYQSDDNMKMLEVKLDRCKYHSTFETKNGKIELIIDHNKSNNCHVRLTYFDKINGEIIKEKSKDDL
jgi:hypothetical protein